MARCFVVSGFHTKKDFATNRELDLDASYAVIKETVEAAGLECIRADEIRHAGTIDVPMFRELLEADLVIADLSTSNVNAAYELGVRHALRPRRTIIIAESKFPAPFDVSHIVIWRYEHLGTDIGNKEAIRIRKELKEHIEELMAKEEPDSPVYEFLKGLEPPSRGEAPALLGAAEVEGDAAAKEGDPETVAMLMKLAMQSKRLEEFSDAETYLKKLVATQPNDTYLLQQLALVTYKGKQPDPVSALERAEQVLLPLNPEETLDTETVGLWAAIRKRMWQEQGEAEDLDSAIRGLEKIYGLKSDWYNGINLAFLLNARAASGGADDPQTDAMQASWIRRRVIKACEAELADRKDEFDVAVDERDEKVRESQYWLLATLREAAFGLGDDAQAEHWANEANATKPPGWMLSSTEDQLGVLAGYLAATSPPDSP